MANRVPERDRPELKNRLIQHLGKGKARAKQGILLAQQCQYEVSDPDRAIRMMILELIEEGHPIASSTGKPPGYFIAETVEEVKEYDTQLLDRIKGVATRKRGFKKAALRITHPEQLRMTIY